ncbi:hypothetical protein ACFW04_013561 [Cataglyphis niger]
MAQLVRTSAEYNRKAAIIEGLRTGRLPTEIIKFLGYPRSTVYDIAKYAALEKSEEGSADPARKILLKEKAQELILEDPGTAVRKLTTDLGNETMRRIAEENLRYMSYVIRVRKMLSEAAKTKRRRLSDIMPPHFFKKGETIMKEIYLWSLKTS